MADNKIQIKRTTISGRTPNTTNSGNTAFIDAGELAVNLTDRKLFSSNGSVAFEVGANLSSLNVDGNVTIGGNLSVTGATISISGNNLSITDSMLYLNQGVLATITNISGNGSVVTFTANNNYASGWDVYVTAVDPSSYNGTYTNILTANATHFTVANTNTATYVSGGTARGKTDINPDIGFAAGYNDGTYHHTGFFRDASDGRYKVFDSYLPEPDESQFIDTSNASFKIADFQSNTLYVNAINANGTIGTAGQGLVSNGTGVYWADNPGYTGSIGFTGSRGDTGFVGSQGIQGDIGYTGSQGDIGFTGSRGDTGFVGSQGIQGDIGYTGSIGFTGSRGDTGFVGSQGDIGYTGSKGDLGYTGSQGIQGIIGYTGSAITGAINWVQNTAPQAFANTTDSFPKALVSVTITTSGAPVQIGAYGDAENKAGASWGKLQLYRGSTPISGNVHYEGSAGSENSPFAFTHIDNPSAGTYTYYLYCTEIAGSNTHFGESSGPTLNAIELQNVRGYSGSLGYTGSQGDIGYTGSQGIQGVIGFTGSKGDQGDIGFTGSQGDTGYTGSASTIAGPTGYTGSKGDIGYTGSKGDTGFIGSKGYTGSQGDIGYTGSQGIQGDIGFTGSRGITGFTGSDGFTGSRGDFGYTGSAGSTGAQGIIGFTGSQGEIGFTGSQGDTGFVGSQGIQGIQGEIGFTGSQGNTGFVGSQGIQGIQGVIGHTGSQGIIGFTGSQGIQGDIGFTGSQGSQGVIGYTGSAGVTGEQGVTGFAGSRGDTGFTGSFGYTGSQGEIGFTGSRGDTGFTGSIGFTGSRGDTGFTGSQGDTGFVGSQGDIGFTGFTGSIGFTGSDGFTGSRGDFGYTGSAGTAGSLGFTGSRGALEPWSVRTSNYTAVDGDRVLADTSAGTFTVTLPATPINGAYVQISDANDFNTVNLTVARNGSTIEGLTDDVILDLKGCTFEFIYNGSTWQVTATTGAKGYAGSRGDAGFTGSIGFTGSQGPIGYTGSFGEIGFTGSKGDTGFIGSTGFTGSMGVYQYFSYPIEVVTGTTQAANTDYHYVLTNAASTTVTLPGAPLSGDLVWVTVANARLDNTVARNGKNIQGLAEDLILDATSASVLIRYIDNTVMWRIV